MRILPLLMLLSLAGCGASVGAVTTADGRPAYLARCGGLLAAHLDCRLKATEVCTPNGYQPIVAVPGSGRLTFACLPPQPQRAVTPPA